MFSCCFTCFFLSKFSPFVHKKKNTLHSEVLVNKVKNYIIFNDLKSIYYTQSENSFNKNVRSFKKFNIETQKTEVIYENIEKTRKFSTYEIKFFSSQNDDRFFVTVSDYQYGVTYGEVAEIKNDKISHIYKFDEKILGDNPEELFSIEKNEKRNELYREACIDFFQDTNNVEIVGGFIVDSSSEKVIDKNFCTQEGKNQTLLQQNSSKIINNNFISANPYTKNVVNTLNKLDDLEVVEHTITNFTGYENHTYEITYKNKYYFLGGTNDQLFPYIAYYLDKFSERSEIGIDQSKKFLVNDGSIVIYYDYGLIKLTVEK